MEQPADVEDAISSQPWPDYCADGRCRALALGNRGPLRFGADGILAPDILAAYRRTGFYAFTGVLGAAEVAELAAGFNEVLANAPVAEGSDLDRHGRPVRFPEYYTLSDPAENAAPDAPAIVGLVSHPLLMMDAALRAYGHPDILRLAASVHGEDFVPFHEAVFHKGAGEGPPTRWHQDGRTHWAADGAALEQADGSGKTHGFNLSVSWSCCTPENCLWVVPGSHRRWRLAGGGKFPPVGAQVAAAVPMLLEPGDCGMVNRSSLHGAFANRSRERRITMVLGFHKRSAAIGTTTTNVHAFPRPGREKVVTYTEEDVLRRTRMIPLAIDARRARFPEEASYRYAGAYLGSSTWNEETRAEIGRKGEEYWRGDITL